MPLFHPLAGSTHRVLARHYRANRPYSRRSLASRCLARTLVAFRWPFYAYERRRWRSRLAAHRLSEDPIFIIGHWSSGTSHLHNLLAADPQFGWLSFANSLTPWDMLGWWGAINRFVMDKLLPKTRGFDNLKIGVDLPQEEEMALANLNTISYYNSYYFPQRFMEHFRRGVLLEGLSESERQEFGDAYRTLATKLSYRWEGRRLLFKNPCAIGRMLFLKELFPRAKFIHIVRNPYHVFASSLRRVQHMLKAFSWQQTEIDLQEQTFEIYTACMQRFLDHKAVVAEADLVEIRYEHLIEDPRRELAGIYEALSLERSAQAVENVESHLSEVRDYKRNRHSLTRAQADRIATDWSFALERWGYSPPDDVTIE